MIVILEFVKFYDSLGFQGICILLCLRFVCNIFLSLFFEGWDDGYERLC